MRKLILSAVLVVSCFSLFAQNLDDVQDKISKGKYDEARQQIDKILSDSKHQNNANAWYYKGVVYNSLAADSTKTDQDYRQEAFNSLKRYYELDPKNVMGTLEQNGRLFLIYEGYYNNAIKDYNASKFESSFNNFRNALAVEEFIRQKGFSYNGMSFPAIDTNLILNIGATALKAKMEDSAIAYYQRLADAKIKTNNLIEVYQMLVDYYGRKGDEANRAKYAALGKELYPESDYWLEAELTPLKEDKPKLLAKYQELTKANPNSYYLNYNYAVELYNYLYANDKKPEDAATYEPLVEEAINNAIKADPTPDANLLMVRSISEKIYKLEDQARTIKDAKKKQATVTETKQLWDKMAPYAEAAFNGYTGKSELKGYEKGNLKFISNILVDYYTMKKQTDKAKMYQDKIKEFGL